MKRARITAAAAAAVLLFSSCGSGNDGNEALQSQIADLQEQLDAISEGGSDDTSDDTSDNTSADNTSGSEEQTSGELFADGSVFYDAGTFNLNPEAKQAYGWESVLAEPTVVNGKTMTVPATSNVGAVEMTQDDTEVNMINGKHFYIAKGVCSVSGGTATVDWTIKAWPEDQNDVGIPDQTSLQSIWDSATDPYVQAAPEWTEAVWGGGSWDAEAPAWLEIVTFDPKGKDYTTNGYDDVGFGGYVYSSESGERNFVLNINDTDTPVYNATNTATIPLYVNTEDNSIGYDEFFRSLNTAPTIANYSENALPGSSQDPDNPYQYHLSNVEGQSYTSYPIYAVHKYVAWFWGQKALVQLYSANPTMTGFQLLDMNATVDLNLNSLNDSAYGDGTKYAIYEYSGIVSTDPSSFPGAQGSTLRVAELSGMTPGNAYINLNSFKATYSDAEGLAPVTSSEIRDPMLMASVTYTTDSGTMTVDITNSRTSFDIKFSAKYKWSDDSARLSVTLTSNDLNN